MKLEARSSLYRRRSGSSRRTGSEDLACKYMILYKEEEGHDEAGGQQELLPSPHRVLQQDR
jgi:hypothetical protein